MKRIQDFIELLALFTGVFVGHYVSFRYVVPDLPSQVSACMKFAFGATFGLYFGALVFLIFLPLIDLAALPFRKKGPIPYELS